MLVARALGTYAHSSHSHFIAANQRFASLLYSAIARAHRQCSVRDRQKRIVGIEENAMPAENIRAAHSVLTGISARPISKSSLTERLHRPTPTQKRPCAGLRGIFGRNWWPQCRLRVKMRRTQRELI